MAVSSTTRKETFTMGTADYDFTFRALISSPEDIKCQTLLISTGATADLTYTTDYTVAIDSDGVGGTVTVSNTQSTLYNLIVYRETTNTQESQYDNYNQFPATTLTTDIDKRTLVSQELEEAIGRSVVLPISSTITGLTLPTPSVGLGLKWNATADGLTNTTADPDTSAASAAASAAAAALSETAAEAAETDAEAAQVAAELAQAAAEAAAATIPDASGGAVADQIRVNATQDAYELFTPDTATGVRDVFTDASLSSGQLVITHSKGLAATSGTLLLNISDNNLQTIIPDEVLFGENTITVDLTSYGTLTGTWGYYYI